MVNYTVINSNATVSASLNAASKTVPKKSMRKGITLDATELAAAIQMAGITVVKDAPTRAYLRATAKVMQYGTRTVTVA